MLRARCERLDFIPRSAHTKRAMTNEELLNDLKQFIEATISQQMAGFATKDDLANFATKDDIKALDEKLDTVQDAIAETVTQALEPIDTTLQDHEQRLGRLERRSA
jgi:hypothetical protein